ncbi:MAG: hypothetical protein US76_03725 [Parcubacteria group bacterium GW2011_GWA2_38_13b]|nr:MAG: hypothetical protein US76_03725 [Parcubacteria group bacterium GW2011_GWA2_38_13b]
MTIYIFGNADLQFDSLPIKILPKLQKNFPNINFKIKDPNEEWDFSEKCLYIIDTIIGIEKVAVFNDISVFKKSPRFSIHDFDLYADLLLMKKIKKLPNCIIIGVPPEYNAEKAYNEITNKIFKLTRELKYKIAKPI